MSVRAVLFWLCLLASACARSSEPREAFEPEVAQRAPLPNELHGLTQAHAEADAAEVRGDYAAADAVIAPWLDEARLRALGAVERRAVQQDVWFRRGRIALALGKPQLALAHAEAGLALGDEETLFSANLQILLGRAAEKLGRDERASEAYHRALRIHERLLNAQLNGDKP